LSPEERKYQGIADGLIRFSVGIEEVAALQSDIDQAIKSLL
jgi:cystathionine beta-lyase